MDIEETNPEGGVSEASSEDVTSEPTLRDIIENSLDSSAPKEEGVIDEPKKEDTLDVEKEPSQAQRARDERGRFKSKAESEPQVATPSEVNPQIQAVEAPQRWRPEHRAAYAAATPEVRAAIDAREKDFSEFERITTARLNRAENGMRAIEEVVKPHGYLLEKYQCSLPEAVDRLLWWNGRLEENPAQALAEMASTYGYQIQVVGTPEARRESPEVERLRYELELTKKEREAQAKAIEEEKTRSAITSWALAKDEKGTPLRPYFEDFKPHIRERVAELESAYPDASPEQILSKAYDDVVGMMKQRGFIRENTGPSIEEIQAKTARAKAASSLKAEPTSQSESVRSPKSLRDAINYALDIHSRD